jgi:hypothetical protein
MCYLGGQQGCLQCLLCGAHAARRLASSFVWIRGRSLVRSAARLLALTVLHHSQVFVRDPATSYRVALAELESMLIAGSDDSQLQADVAMFCQSDSSGMPNPSCPLLTRSR